MTPEERTEFEKLKKMVRAMHEVTDVAFIESLNRRLDFLSGDVTLNELSDVDTSGVTNGQVIKYNSSNQTWENANDIDT